MSTLATILTTNYHFNIYTQIALAFFAGLLPVLVWLWFWEHEDKHPEPKTTTFLVFFAGMLSVVSALIFEQFSSKIVTDLTYLFFIWAAIEELIKFAVVYFIVITRAENHEPIDNMMYMIVAALGFSAVENALFIFNPLSAGSHIEALATGNIRFFGATLLHTVASSIIGYAMAITFYRSKKAQALYVTIGVISAIVLHATFNLTIIGLNESFPILPFYGVWVVIVLLRAEDQVRTGDPTLFRRMLYQLSYLGVR
jgi:RsiW-degrading membrane proteinase PrsW (M82 family)